MATKMAGKGLGGLLTAIFATSMAWCHLGEKHCCIGETHCHHFASPKNIVVLAPLNPPCDELLQLVENKDRNEECTWD